MKQFLIERVPVQDAAVIEKLLPVIRGENEQYLVHQIRLAQEAKEPGQFVVHLADARVIQIDQVGGVAFVESEVSPTNRAYLPCSSIGQTVERLDEFVDIGSVGPVVAVRVVIVEEEKERLGAQCAQPLHGLVGDPGRRAGSLQGLFDVHEFGESTIEAIASGQKERVHDRPRPVAPPRENRRHGR